MRERKSMRGDTILLNVLLYLIMNDYEIVEVLDLWTLHHYRLTDMHELCLCSADNKTFFEATRSPCGIVDDVCLDYSHKFSLPENFM